MAQPTAVTVDSNDDILFWSNYDTALEFVEKVGGRIQVIPDDIEEDEPCSTEL